MENSFRFDKDRLSFYFFMSTLAASLLIGAIWMGKMTVEAYWPAQKETLQVAQQVNTPAAVPVAEVPTTIKAWVPADYLTLVQTETQAFAEQAGVKSPIEVSVVDEAAALEKFISTPHNMLWLTRPLQPQETALLQQQGRQVNQQLIAVNDAKIPTQELYLITDTTPAGSLLAQFSEFLSSDNNQPIVSRFGFRPMSKKSVPVKAG